MGRGILHVSANWEIAMLLYSIKSFSRLTISMLFTFEKWYDSSIF